MDIKKYQQAWAETIDELKNTSECAALGWFDKKGNLLAANQSMCVFLGTTQEKAQSAYQFVNPSFEKISQMNPLNGIVFEGLLTIGNFRDVSFVFNAKIFFQDDVYLVYATADAVKLFQENKKMSRLNQEVNNLQRQVLKEKAKLEQALNELKETQQMLIQSEKMNALGQMVAGVAHEINNPIAFVTNNLYELEKNTKEYIQAFNELKQAFLSAENSKADEITHNICAKYETEFLAEDISDILIESKSGVQRVKKIVEDLRRFSRLDESEIKHIDLIENLKSTFSIIQSEIDKKNISFTFHSEEEVMLDCFPGQLNQAVLNILINAIQAVDNGGKIGMNIKTDENDVLIIIHDNGCGIAPADVKKVFNPFFTTKEVGSGTGLGLSITYKIINELHKGAIELKSEIGKGTTFSVSIPRTIKN